MEIKSITAICDTLKLNGRNLPTYDKVIIRLDNGHELLIDYYSDCCDLIFMPRFYTSQLKGKTIKRFSVELDEEDMPPDLSEDVVDFIENYHDQCRTHHYVLLEFDDDSEFRIYAIDLSNGYYAGTLEVKHVCEKISSKS